MKHSYFVKQIIIHLFFIDILKKDITHWQSINDLLNTLKFNYKYPIDIMVNIVHIVTFKVHYDTQGQYMNDLFKK